MCALLQKNLDQRIREQIRKRADRFTQLISHLRGIDPKKSFNKRLLYPLSRKERFRYSLNSRT